MTFISFKFIIAVFLLLFIYWIFPKRFRWIVLLIGSVVFYYFAGWEKLIYVLATGGIVFFLALRIEHIYTSLKYSGLTKEEKKRRSKEYLIIGIATVVFLLVYAKVGNSIFKSILNLNGLDIKDVDSLIIPLGISYYSFSLVGYLADVYWRKDSAERNFFRFLLYMIYFPQILQGPIPRHERLAPQFIAERKFDYKTFCFGLQRAVWGYFKKLVIADRFAVIVNTVYGNTDKYGGQYVIIAILASVVHMYCDFSGCVDISLGISESFGIKLDENFERPFFSRSAAEFWRRWHITLGTWFKDYIYMTIVLSPRFVKVSKKIKERFGVRARKNFMSIVPLACVWILTGLWHGTGLNYILWGVYWGLIIILSTLLQPEVEKISKKLKIPIDSKGWHIFQMFRTFFILCFSRLVTAPGSIKLSWKALKSIFLVKNPWIWVDKSIYTLGLDRPNFWVGVISVVFLFIISLLQEHGIKIRESVSKWFLPIRWAVYFIVIFAVIVFGMYGPGYDADSFVYMNF